MAVLFTVLLCLSSAVLGYFSYFFNRGHYIQGAGAVIDTELQYLVAADGRGDLINSMDWAAKRTGRVYSLVDSRKNVIAGNLRILPRQPKTLIEGTLIFTQDGRDYAAKIHLFDDGRNLLAGLDITNAAKSYRVMQWLSFLSIALMAVVILFSFMISTFVVSRTNRIAMTAKSIMDTGDLSKRIAIDARWDDLSHMAYVLNSFLKRVEDLMSGIRRVSDNVAHDLRTPLTRLLNNLESLRENETVKKEDAALHHCDLMIAETNRLLSTFNALLRIANIEARKQRQNFSQAALDKIILDVADLYEPLAESKSILVELDIAAVSMTCDKDLLFQVFANLFDNAIKFTPPGGRVFVGLSEEKNRPIFFIRDSGPGIQEIDRKKIFDRFYRADMSRSTEGSGLGLSLVKAIVTLHEAKISLTESDTGAAFTIRF